MKFIIKSQDVNIGNLRPEMDSPGPSDHYALFKYPKFATEGGTARQKSIFLWLKLFLKGKNRERSERVPYTY